VVPDYLAVIIASFAGQPTNQARNILIYVFYMHYKTQNVKNKQN